MQNAFLVSTQNGVAAIEGGAELARVLPQCLAQLVAAKEGQAIAKRTGERNVIAELAAILRSRFGSTPGVIG